MEVLVPAYRERKGLAITVPFCDITAR